MAAPPTAPIELLLVDRAIQCNVDGVWLPIPMLNQEELEALHAGLQGEAGARAVVGVGHTNLPQLVARDVAERLEARRVELERVCALSEEERMAETIVSLHYWHGPNPTVALPPLPPGRRIGAFATAPRR
tara:strand:+ start:245 stop:634 length:390 start_codon:yes stop_codon:yes gene_type:complete